MFLISFLTILDLNREVSKGCNLFLAVFREMKTLSFFNVPNFQGSSFPCLKHPGNRIESQTLGPNNRLQTADFFCGFLLGNNFVALLHIPFSILYMILIAKKVAGSFLYKKHEDVVLKGCGNFHKAAVGSCVYLTLLYLADSIWLFLHQFQSQWLYLEIGATVQAVAWLLISFLTIQLWRKGAVWLPVILRAWWIMSFLLYIFPAIFSLLLSFHQNYNVNQVLNVASFPAYVFLFLAGIRGITGASSLPSQLEEPFLNTDHEPSTPDQVTEYSRAGILSLVTFSWITSLLKKGSKEPLEVKDIPLLGHSEKALTNYELLFKIWSKLKAKHSSGTQAMIYSLFKAYWKPILLTASFGAVNTCASYMGPYLINDLVEYLGGRIHFQNEGISLTLLFLGSKIIENVADRQWSFRVQLLDLQVRSALTAFVYHKGMHLSSSSRQSHTSGEIINYMAVDVVRISEFTWYMHQSWSLPLQITLALIILFKNVGLAAFATLIGTIAIVAANIPLASMQEKFQSKIMKAKDERMKGTTECLRSMRILKLKAWERAYLQKLENLRSTEYGWLQKYFFARSAVIFVFWTTPMVVSVITFGTCILLGIPLTAGRVLSTLATIRVLQEPLIMFPDFISESAQFKVSLERLCGYFEEAEIQEDAVIRLPKIPNSEAFAIDIKGAAFSWDTSSERPTLSIVELHIKEGTTVAVCGGVGTGKSSLLSCILGEIPKLFGEVKLRGSTAYVGQTAWIQSGKVEDNILFGTPMNRTKYEKVLDVCQLQKDLELLAYGDQTEIGERGINLSGGQKQRIQLARAVYQDADIYLLDDPFSAVDVQTGTEIFKECILGVLASKTVILVTHQVEFLPATDHIVVLRDGKIVQAGTFHEILQDDTDFESLVGAHTKAMELVGVSEIANSTIDSNSSQDNDNGLKNNSTEIVEVVSTQLDKKNTNKQLVDEEEREKGRVSIEVYWSYISAVHGGALVPLMLGAQICFQIFQIAGNWWMAEQTPASSKQQAKIPNSMLLGVYCALSLGGAIVILIRTLLVSVVGLATAQKFYFDMLNSLFHAPMSFFDSTPTGRILNRVSTDQSTLDLELSWSLSGLAFRSIQLLSVAVVMSQAAWEVFLVFVPVTIACFRLQRYYILTARELSRLVGIQKAPIIHHFGESLVGAATIRGFDQEQRFMDKSMSLVDSYACPLFHTFAAMEWICLWLELLTNIVFSFTIILLVSLPFGSISPSLAGLAVTYSLNLNMLQAGLVWNLCNVENKIISVERMKQYSCISSEAPWLKDDSQPPQGWPSKGEVQLHSLQVRYSPHSPIVLHDLTCTFPGRKKVGIVGRTGSGKSTLLQALFRIVEPSRGSILIDAIDISTIGLHDLRSRLSIIPQEPTMFEGTVRYNLDPLAEHSDEEVWRALDKCELGGILRAKEEKLDCPVGDNGENWSVGQRQLFALGRVMLKQTRILVLDEATASVDSVTDAVIQATLRKEFHACTVITIAHRLPTVMDSDLVLVLSDGRIVEYDQPSKLLASDQSVFYKLVSEYSKSSNHVKSQTNLATQA